MNLDSNYRAYVVLQLKKRACLSHTLCFVFKGKQVRAICPKMDANAIIWRNHAPPLMRTHNGSPHHLRSDGKKDALK